MPRETSAFTRKFSKRKAAGSVRSWLATVPPQGRLFSRNWGKLYPEPVPTCCDPHADFNAGNKPADVILNAALTLCFASPALSLGSCAFGGMPPLWRCAKFGGSLRRCTIRRNATAGVREASRSFGGARLRRRAANGLRVVTHPKRSEAKATPHYAERQPYSERQSAAASIRKKLKRRLFSERMPFNGVYERLRNANEATDRCTRQNRKSTQQSRAFRDNCIHGQAPSPRGNTDKAIQKTYHREARRKHVAFPALVGTRID